MDEKRSSLPVIVALFLLLPVLYVGSYLALVKPGQYGWININHGERVYVRGYRYFGHPESEMTKLAPVVFWPLEQIDRRLRPDEWAKDDRFFFFGACAR
jgi:hypothetical protein